MVDSAVEKPDAFNRILELFEDRFEVLRGEDGLSYYRQRGNPVVGRLSKVRGALLLAFHDKYNTGCPGQALTEVIDLLGARAAKSPAVPVSIRFATDPNGIVWVDPCDDALPFVVIASGAMGFVPPDVVPVLFVRPEHSLPAGAHGGTEGPEDYIAWLQAALMIHDADVAAQLIAFMVTALLGYPTPLALIQGPQDSGKSTLIERVVSILDPSSAAKRGRQEQARDWIVAAATTRALSMDNISSLSLDRQDDLCRAVTGETAVHRKLHSDSELSILKIQCAVMVTGIALGRLNQDLVSRCLPINLDPIPQTGRKDEEALRAEFDERVADLRGGLYRMGAAVLDTIPSMREKIDNLPRMTNFGLVLASVDHLCGTDGYNAYRKAHAELVGDMLEADPVGAALVAFIEQRGTWSGSASELHEALNVGNVLVPRSWPPTPHHLSARLRELAPALAKRDIRVTWERTKTARTISLIAGDGTPADVPVILRSVYSRKPA